MYDAKRGLAGVAHYSSDRDPYSARRLSLIGDLARALEDGTLELHYQPQADAGHRPGDRRRGAAALEPPAVGQRAAGRVHPARRAHRSDPAADPVRRRDRGPPVRRLAGRRAHRC